MNGTFSANLTWQRSFISFLLGQGFSQLTSDKSMYRKVTPATGGDQTMIIGLYPTTIYSLSSHNGPGSLFESTSASISALDYTDAGSLLTDLMTVECDTSVHGHIRLHQREFIKSIIALFSDANSRPSHRSSRTPSDPSIIDHVLHAVYSDLDPNDASRLNVTQSASFRDLVLALTHCASNTRPDIAFATGYVSRGLDNPTNDLLADALRILYYLEDNLDIGLTYRTSEKPLYGMSDSDWALRRSTSGWLFSYASCAISWASSEQPSIALSSCEAEVMAASEAAIAATQLDHLLSDLGLSLGEPISLGLDNKAARDLAYNPEHHDKTKHIPRKYFWLRELVEEHRITVPYVNTLDNMADFFTKSLPAKSFFKMRDHIMNIGSTATSGREERGGVAAL